ncbi:MAG: hypothetical protein HQL45_07435 [Alphaproteobacteria bacterium]|nr:hypothetical protein [Alphaproteobacteria bacterium]
MPTFNDLFVRDSLQDTGVVPSPGYPYTSPDIICYQQVADPTTTFTNNYNTDPNIPYEIGVYNYVYVRASNLSTQPASGTMKVYVTDINFVLTPNTWINKAMTTGGGQNFVALPQVPAPQPTAPSISVATTPFMWQPPTDNKHYCAIGQVITQSHPNNIPASFSKWDDFVMWVRNNQNICWRNLSIVNNLPNPQWDQPIPFNNITSQQSPIMFIATCTNLPIGSTVTLKCDALSINVSNTITNVQQYVYGPGMCPGGFAGYLETMVFLPSGKPWSGSISTAYYVGVDSDSAASRFALDLRCHAVDPQALSLGNGNLIEAGNCSFVFGSPPSTERLLALR